MEQNTLRIAPIQMDIVWGDKRANFNKVRELCLPLKGKADIVVLPETFSTGFGAENTSMVEQEDGECFTFVSSLSTEINCAVIGSWLIMDKDGEVKNRAFVVLPNGKYIYYDKRHLFRKEKSLCKSGEKQLVVEYLGWFINVIICYDLRFPAWCRNVNNAYDLQICIANWPEGRKEVWSTLLKARAIENQSYVVGVNRVGKDNTQTNHTGNTSVYDYIGKVRLDYPEDREGADVVEIHREELLLFRSKFPAWMDADSFMLL